MKLTTSIRRLEVRLRRYFSRKRHDGWHGISILIFRENLERPTSLRINYFLLIFVVTLFALPLVGLGYNFVRSQMADQDPRKQLEERRVLLHNLQLISSEREELFAAIESRQRLVEQELAGGRSNPLQQYLSRSKRQIEARHHHPYEQGSGRGMRSIQLHHDYAELLLEQTAYHSINQLWNRMIIHHAMPRGRPLHPGVGMITSGYGFRSDPFGLMLSSDFHAGVDFAAAQGTPLIATASGEVIRAVHTTEHGYGLFIRIHHGFGYTSLYAHNVSNEVDLGDAVERGQMVARLGRTGRATGNHIHYEVQIGAAQQVEPMDYVQLR